MKEEEKLTQTTSCGIVYGAIELSHEAIKPNAKAMLWSCTVCHTTLAIFLQICIDIELTPFRLELIDGKACSPCVLFYCVVLLNDFFAWRVEI